MTAQKRGTDPHSGIELRSLTVSLPASGESGSGLPPVECSTPGLAHFSS
jgi:hypothetical protein